MNGNSFPATFSALMNQFPPLIKGLKFEIAGVVCQSSTKNTRLTTISKELVYIAKKDKTDQV